MSDLDAYESDMGWLSKLSDEEIEQVLSGDYAGDDANLGDLAAFARDAKATLRFAPDDSTRVAHVTAMAELAADLVPARVRTPKPPAPGPFRKVKVVLTSLFATLIGKVALVGVALAATTGGLAATGSLPDPAQEALARAAEKVGFELPASDDTGEDEAGVPDELPEGTEGSSAPSVLDVIRSWGDEKGCDFGHAVAAAAGGNPGPCENEQVGNDEGRSNGKGRPEGVGSGKGRPEGAGKPEGTPEGKPAGAGEGQGKPEGTPDSKPEGAGKPEGTPGGGNPGAGGNGAGDAGPGSNTSGNGAVGAPSGSNGGNGNGGGEPSFVPSGKP